jgi:hypothetical protein
VERVEHTFLFCSYAEEVWEAIKECYGIHLQRRFFLSPRQWLFDVLERCSGIQTTAITLTFWHLWEARNDARNNEGIIHPRRIVEKIKAYVDMVVLHCFKKPQASRCESISSPLKWTPPRRHYLDECRRSYFCIISTYGYWCHDPGPSRTMFGRLQRTSPRVHDTRVGGGASHQASNLFCAD